MTIPTKVTKVLDITTLKNTYNVVEIDTGKIRLLYSGNSQARFYFVGQKERAVYHLEYSTPELIVLWVN